MSLIETDIGDSLVVRGTLTDEAGAAVTGATVTARSIDPAGTEASLGPATEEGTTGVYAVTFEPDAAGTWLIRLESAAPNKAAAEGTVYVRATRFS